MLNPLKVTSITAIPTFIDPDQITEKNYKHLERYVKMRNYYHEKCNPLLQLFRDSGGRRL